MFFFSSRRRHTRWNCDWSSDVCSSDLVLPATGQNLRTVFRGKNACVAAGSPGALCAGKILTPSTTSLGPIAEDTRRQLEQLEDIAPERRHMLNFVAGDGAGD